MLFTRLEFTMPGQHSDFTRVNLERGFSIGVQRIAFLYFRTKDHKIFVVPIADLRGVGKWGKRCKV